MAATRSRHRFRRHTEGDRIRRSRSARPAPQAVLDWAGLEAGGAFVDFELPDGIEALREATRIVGLGPDGCRRHARRDVLASRRRASERGCSSRRIDLPAGLDRGLGSSGLECDSHDHAWRSRFFLEYRHDPLTHRPGDDPRRRGRAAR